MHKLRSKLIGYFVKTLLLSLLLSSAFMALMCAGFVDGELLSSQRKLAATAMELASRTSLAPEEIAQALSSADYRLHLGDWALVDDAGRAQLASRGQWVTGHFMNKSLYFTLSGALMAVEAYPANMLLITALLRSLLGNLLLILIGFLVVYALSRRVAQPIVNLTEATRQVAKGNFDISVDAHAPLFAGGIKEVAELADNFNLMAHELKSVEYLRRDFTSSLSHELKTPVASISGYARLLTCEGITDEERHEYAQVIASESARLSSLSDNLLKLTRLESHPPVRSGEKFKLDEQLRRCATALHPAIERKGQSLTVELHKVSIEADEMLLMQVWDNLLGNATKFTPPGGHIRLTLTRKSGEARVTVEDDGIGIDEADQARIFEKFYQADLSHHMGGNGLGLSLVKRIVDICQGRIELVSSPGKGARFTVTLPAK